MDVTPTNRTASRDFYQAYLNSPDWRRQRNRALQRAFFQCQRCGARRGLEVHHLSYDRLGAELDADLEVLCRDCHVGEHAGQMADSSHRVYLALAGAMQREHMFASISELSAAVKAECVRLKMPYDTHQIERALEFICGTTIQTPAPSKTQPQVEASMGREISTSEAREILHRLGIASAIKTMRSTPQTIDIYGPIPREDNWGEHDRY